jgi:hypothetical protein
LAGWKRRESKILDEINKFLQTNVCPSCEPQDGFLDVTTLATIADDQTGKEIMYWANPGWNSKRLHKGGWMDWALEK